MKPQVSLVFPVWNEEDTVEILYARVCDACLAAGITHEMVFVDNGSTDGSLRTIKRLAEVDPRVSYVSLSRNFGHQGALFAGMSFATGDAVITMDADLQHPPSLIPKMVQLWREGFEVVYTIKRNHVLPPLRLRQVQLFYWILSKLSGLSLSFGQSDFRLLDRKVVDVILGIPENRKFLRGTVEWVGFRQAGLEYNVAERYAGTSKFSYRSLVSFALDGILAFSTLPLRWVFSVGVVIAALSLCYTAYAVVVGLLKLSGVDVVAPPGWGTLVAAVTFLGAVELLAVGILGEYIGRIYDQTKGRPVFIIREASARPKSFQ